MRAEAANDQGFEETKSRGDTKYKLVLEKSKSFNAETQAIMCASCAAANW